MKGLGTILNAALILVGGGAGLLVGKRIRPQMRDTLMTVTGVAVMMMGAGGALAQMLRVENGRLETDGTMMMIVSLAAGGLIGEVIGIEDAVGRFGEWLKRKSGSGGDAGFVDAFVSASCTVCIGAMAIVGAIADGISGDYSTLLAKGILDAIIVCMMASARGKGCVFSAIPVAALQGAVTAIAAFAGGFLPQSALDHLSYVGSVLIFCVGLNLVRERQIRAANLLPALVIAAVWP